jgi:hypothetical protein
MTTQVSHVESLWNILHLFSKARIFSQFVEIELSLFSCQEPSNGSYPDQYEPLILSSPLFLGFERSLFPLDLTTRS